MSKVICDICGTAYPETANQCPICGSAKQVDSNSVTGPAAAPAVKAPTKGGRFSNANVKKRNKAANRSSKSDSNEKNEKETKSGTVIVAWVLLVAVLMVLAYIIIQFVVPMFKQGKPDTTNSVADVGTTASTQTAADATTAAQAGVPCTGLAVEGSDTIFLDTVGRAWLIEAKAQPENTTDVITYSSSDESVATVDAQGRVTRVGNGKAIIFITCGDVTKQCNVICDSAPEATTPNETTATTTAPIETTPAQTTEPPVTTEPTQETTPAGEEKFGLFRGEYTSVDVKYEDITLSAKGESFEFVTRDGVSLSDITWKSDNPAIAKVENGKVTAVAPGETVIRGSYNGETDSCTIRCAFDGESPEGSGNSSEENPEWPHLYPAEDVSIHPGESFELSYVNESGEIVDIDWHSDNGGIASVSGNTVTGVGYGVTGIHGVYGDDSITCIVRVLE